MKSILFFLLVFSIVSCSNNNEKEDGAGGWQNLAKNAKTLGKERWQPMLSYVATLHKESTHPPVWPFELEWEEIGPGYVYGPAFGHWDIIHQVIDVMPYYPEHALKQLKNNVKNQEPWGLLPGSFWMPGAEWSSNDSATWSTSMQGHPPVWAFAVNDYVKRTGEDTVFRYFYTPLIRQIAWFENSRNAEGEGFYYNDILTKRWESGVDDGVRFDETDYGKWACIDATSHAYYLYKTAAVWADKLGMYDPLLEERRDELEKFIQTKLYAEDDGLFYDIWAIQDTSLRTLAFETIWPVVVGAATEKQANILIDEYLLDTNCFLTEHPIATVGKKDPKFELRMWRGPAWNSMTYWAARGCLNYGREDAARIILEKALDASAKQFKRTGTIWEFYHPLGGKPEQLMRKPNTDKNTPCHDYLGHNPLIAMARMYEMLTQ